jgi:hypothetical protein
VNDIMMISAKRLFWCVVLLANIIALSVNVAAKQSTVNSNKIVDGKYLEYHPTESWIVVKGNSWYGSDLDGDEPPKKTTELKYIRYGVILHRKTYSCLLTLLPKNRNVNHHFKCTYKGWVRDYH